MLILLRALFIVTVFALTAMAAPPTDTEATRLLVGSWVSGEPRAPGGTTFKADGTFTSDGTFATRNGPITIKVEGKWHVKDGILIEELTRSSHPNIVPVGLTTRDTLLSVTEKEYRYRTEYATESGYKRAETPQKAPAK